MSHNMNIMFLNVSKPVNKYMLKWIAKFWKCSNFPFNPQNNGILSSIKIKTVPNLHVNLKLSPKIFFPPTTTLSNLSRPQKKAESTTMPASNLAGAMYPFK